MELIYLNEQLETAKTVAERLKILGLLELPKVPEALAAYAPAKISKNYVYTSGQLPFADGQLLCTGQVDHPRQQQAVVAARQCAINAIAAVKNVLGDLERVQSIVKITGFVSSDPQFTGQPAVVDGASELVLQIFGDRGRHARSAVGVAVLPLDAAVEIEMIVEF